MIGVGLPSAFHQDTPFRLQNNGRALSFFVGDRAAWVIDPDRFSGSPVLDVREQKKRIDIHLRDAFFPGTELPASFQCVLSDDSPGWQLSLSLDCGMQLDAPFTDWLSGNTPAEGWWSPSDLRFCPDLRIRFFGRARVQFRPDWSFDFNGKVAVSLHDSEPLESGGARLSLTGDEQLANVPLLRRTLLSLNRGQSDWNINLGQQSTNAWTLDQDQNLFDLLTAEAGETEHQRVYTSLLSQAPQNPARLQFRPSSALKGETGEPFFLNLTAPRLAAALGETPRTSALIADFSSEKKWVQGQAFSILVGAGADTQPFELLRRDDNTETLNATPELFEAAVPSEEDICSSLKFEDRRGIRFTWANIVQPLERGLAALHLTPWEHGLRIDLTNSVLSVLRTSDLLKLDFRFENLHLSTWFGPRLEPVDHGNPAKAPIITVTFPPQNIAEQAFLEQPPNFELKDFTLPEKTLTWAQKREYEPDLPATQGGSLTPPEMPVWPVQARIAGSSRLVFQIPSNIHHIPFRLSALLDWTKWDLKVHPVALSVDDAAALFPTPGSVTLPKIPDSDPAGYTSIEMPYRMMISPPKGATWTHSPKAVNYGTQFTELWHTRLATLALKLDARRKADERKADENDAAHRTIRAIWSPDYVKAADTWPTHKNFPFRMSLDALDRHEIVHLTSDYWIGKQPDCDSPMLKDYVPGAVQVDQMMLSSLGGWLKSHGNWEPPTITSVNKFLTVEEWRHTAGMGRDHYVKVVYKGYLMPFGHRASLVKVTERKFNQIGNVWGAFLRQRYYIIVREIHKQFPAYGMTPDVARAFKYDMVEAVTLVTPTLEDPNGEGGNQSQFWPRIGPKTPFNFHFRLHNGDVVTECSLPMLFVDNSVAYDPVKSQNARQQYNHGHENDLDDQGHPLPKRQVVPFGGQKIAFGTENQPGDTQYNVNSIKFQVSFPAMTNAMQFQCLYGKGQPAFYPQKDIIDLNPEAVRRIAGKDQLHVIVRYTDKYLQNGFDPVQNLGEVFFEILDPNTLAPSSLDLSFSGGQNGTQSGGVVTPNVGIVGFSRKNGPVGGGGRKTGNTSRLNTNSVQRAASTSLVDKVASGEFDPLDFFGGALAGAKILGAVSLWDIVKPLAAGALSNLDQAPKMLDQTLFPLIQGAVKLETDVVALLTSLPPIVQKQLGAEIQSVRDNLAKVQASPTDLFLQAAFIRSLTQVGDKVRTVLNNPSSLLDPALQQLTQWRTDLENKVIGQVSRVFAPWKDTYNLFLTGIQEMVTGWVLTAQDYQEQIETYRTEIQGRIAALRTQMQVLISLAQDPTKLAQVLVAQVPALGQLEDMRKRLSALIQLAAKQSVDGLNNLRLALTDVQKWTLATGAAQAERDVQNFEAQTQVWIVSIQNASDLSSAQQLVRQASGAMRAAIQKTTQAGVQDFQALQTIHKQLLTSLQQLQTMVFQLPAGVRALAVAPHPQAALLKLFNQSVTEFSVVQQALSAANLETKLSAVLPLLPASVQTDLMTLTTSIGNLRTTITSAGEQAQYTLVGYYLQLFELWQQYQDPFKLAVDVFGFSADDIQKLRALQTQYQTIIVLARQVQASLNALRTDYTNLITTLPTVAQALLNTLTTPVTNAIANVAAAAEDDLLDAERQAINAISDLYLDILRRVERPLDNLADLVNAKNSIEALVKQFGLPQSVTMSYQWKPVIKDFDPVFKVNDGGALTINAAITTYFNGNPPQFAIDGKLTNFTVNLIGSPQFIGIVFDHLNFSSHSGSKPDCQVQIKSVDLAESLSFVKKLESLLSPKDGPFLELNFLGILAGFRFAIPTITVGAFSLQNLRLIVAVSLPFSGDPMRCEFGVSERDNPFLLSVGIFGGGGFFHMRLGLDGVELLEGALEFGVVAEISIGIATGGGYVMAGIYFSVSKTEAQVCGFVHANGHLDVLGLISMDIDAYVQICYVKKDGKTYADGEARLIIHIEILFFSENVELHAHYQFAGSDDSSSSGGGASRALNAAAAARMPANSDSERSLKPPPTPGDYCDLGSAADWNKYRRAFAW